VDPGPILIILQSPVYFPALLILLAYYYCFPLDTLITFVSSKPVRLTPHRKLGAKYLFVCVQVPRCTSITFSRLSRLSCSINVGFITEGKLAATHIIPSSWGSQRAGYSPRTRTSATHPHHRQQFLLCGSIVSAKNRHLYFNYERYMEFSNYYLTYYLTTNTNNYFANNYYYLTNNNSI
jgi:hypothetical protein